MFNKIKEFFTGSKSTVDATQDVPLTAADVAIKNIKETTAAVDAKVEVAPEPVAESKPAPETEQAWTKNPPAAIAKRAPKKQPTKATTAPKKRPPAPK
jgi:hypothetical protein